MCLRMMESQVGALEKLDLRKIFFVRDYNSTPGGVVVVVVVVAAKFQNGITF